MPGSLSLAPLLVLVGNTPPNIEYANAPRPLTRLDMLRFARRLVEQQAVQQLAVIRRWIADE
ncbi:hypothetical protein ABZ876_12985 [Streptomyces sp. NPDC046931]|uniref:hypothetical protein n=1 Tax=Streptomyces sp. NPDC046931 TaxID=3154806 RepID=UPI0034010420